MKFVKLAQTTDVPPGSKIKVTYESKVILLTNIDNNFFAVDNTCTHMGGSLADGKLEGKQIICPKHGSIYDVTTGQVVERGRLFFVKVRVTDLQSYPVKIEGTDILIGIE